VSVYWFKPCRPERFYLGAEVRVAELATALTGTGLTLSNHPNGGIVIHRLPINVSKPTGPRVPLERTVGPEEVA
jgi:hypothetical protein